MKRGARAPLFVLRICSIAVKKSFGFSLGLLTTQQQLQQHN
jgi:hypothetical protein